MAKKKKNPDLANDINADESNRVKRRVIMEFPPNVVQTPITYMLAKDYDIASNILRASISPEESGKLVLEMEGKSGNIEEAIEKIKNVGIKVTEIAMRVSFDWNNCIHCGACISVCLAGALKLDENYKLEFVEPKCTVCEMCVPVCPVDVIEIDI